MRFFYKGEDIFNNCMRILVLVFLSLFIWIILDFLYSFFRSKLLSSTSVKHSPCVQRQYLEKNKNVCVDIRVKIGDLKAKTRNSFSCRIHTPDVFSYWPLSYTSRDNPKSETMATKSSPRSTFRVARSR